MIMEVIKQMIQMVRRQWDRLNMDVVAVSLMTAAIWVIVIVFLAMAFTGCTTTKYVEVERVTHDTLKITKHQRDSIWLHDSVLVDKSGDTIKIEKWHTKYVEKQIHDTLYQSKTDSIPVPYTVEKLVEKQLSGWQNFRIWLGNIALAVGAISVAVWLIRKKKLL